MSGEASALGREGRGVSGGVTGRGGGGGAGGCAGCGGSGGCMAAPRDAVGGLLNHELPPPPPVRSGVRIAPIVDPQAAGLGGARLRAAPPQVRSRACVVCVSWMLVTRRPPRPAPTRPVFHASHCPPPEVVD